ncbi:hypothetical protein OAG71_04235, partial [bacterium]|nr:hypothetical protein [bacterium]
MVPRNYYLCLTILFLTLFFFAGQCATSLAQSPPEGFTFSAQEDVAYDADLNFAFGRNVGDASKARLLD